MYGEEADLCQRARQMGARPTITPTATIIHHGGASETNRADQLIKLLAGKITLMRRHWSELSAFVGRLLYLVFPLTRLVLYGTLGTLLGRADFQLKGHTWHQVWQSRHRWINGWTDVVASSAHDNSSPDAFGSSFDRENVRPHW
jgi:GT2 family glycosyltransferase